MRGITVRHNFETAHRLPHLPGKCTSLHGHSWWAEITVVAGELDERGLVVEFGAFKRAVRRWIDTNLDHGTMLGGDDPLLPVLTDLGCKVYTFADWPTVEAVAEEIACASEALLTTVQRAPDARVLRVVVQETAVNQAMWGAW